MTPKDWNKVQEMMDAQKAELLVALANSGKVVKSIQHGAVSMSSGSKTVSISEVDTSKAFPILAGDGGMMGVSAFTSTSIKISYQKDTGGSTCYCYWTVIEVY